MAKTSKGLEVSLVFFEQDPEDEKGLQVGWVCRRLSAQIGGKEVAYLKVEDVPSQTWFKKVPTLWHWWDRTNWKPEDQRHVWYKAHWPDIVPASMKGSLANPYFLNRDDAPNEATITEDLRVLCRLPHFKGTRELRDFLRYHMDRPKVAYSHTNEDYRRKGIASLLYIEMAKWLATRDFLLWGSTLQSDPVKGLWRSLLLNPELPTYILPAPWDPNTYVPILDFRPPERRVTPRRHLELFDEVLDRC